MTAIADDEQNEPIARHPSAQDWAAIAEAFDRIAALPEDAQEAALAAWPVSDFVANQVRSLLHANRGMGILDQPLFPRGDVRDYASLAQGTQVGQFRVDRLIGRGGAGEVYCAERVTGGFVQAVALKLLRAEAIDRFASFDQERNMLASLDHPGIARLIDGGTAPDGRPYMALEYVAGRTITDWCAGQEASLEARLKLFVEVCDAVAFAHAKLIVHRDIKPSNILIDETGRARLLDFGIAKLIGDATLNRAMTGHAVLTPDYAAPEQLENGTTTVATDVYALGTVLFELLTGARPWQMDGAHMPTILRRILYDDVPVPSRAATAGGTSPIAPARIAGDLDAIILKATRRIPQERYLGVGDLAEDVRRHLALQPVKARQGSRLYFLKRFVQRYRWAVAGVGAALVAILVGTTIIAWQAHRAAIDRDAARAEAGQLKALNDATLLMFRDSTDASRQKSVSVRAMIDGTTQRMIQRLPPDSPNAAPTITALVDLYLTMESEDDAKTLLVQALKRGIGRSDPLNAARFKLRLGTIYARESRFAEAERLLADAERTWNSDATRFRRERVETAGARALILRRTGRRDAAITLLTDTLDDAEQNYVNDDRDLAGRYASITTMLLDSERLAEAGDLLTRADTMLAQTAHPHSEGALNLYRLRAELLIQQGRFAAAEQVFRKLIADRHRYFGPDVALAVDQLRFARMLNYLGRPAEALALVDVAAPMAVEHLAEANKTALLMRAAQSEALVALGRATEAQALLDRVADPLDHLEDDPMAIARYLRARAGLSLAQGRTAAAATALAAARTSAAKLGKGSQDFFLRETAPVEARLNRALRRSASTPTGPKVR